ncbi:MAG: DUF5667 domain-containing protein [Candidatus Komeilibacteria bacterium]
MDNLVKQLNKLKSATPDNAWVIANRERLLSEIDITPARGLSRVLGNFNLGLAHITMAPVRALVILLLVAVGFSTSMMAKASLPGSVLYPGRVVIEKVELMLATTPAQEAEVYSRHASQRINDLRKLTVDKASDEDIQGTAKRLEKDLAAAATSLEIAQAEQSDAAELDELAMRINNNANAGVDVLGETKQSVIAPEALQALDDVLLSTANIEDKTLRYLVSMYGEDKITAEETVSKFVAIIEQQLISLSEQVQESEAKVKEQSLKDAINIDWQTAYAQIRQVSGLLNSAKVSFDGADYKTAFADLTEAKQLIAQVNSQLDQVELPAEIEKK